MKLKILSESATPEFAWYSYVGSRLTVESGTKKKVITEGMKVGIRPNLRNSAEFFLITDEDQKQAYRISKRVANRIAEKGKVVRRVVRANTRTEKVQEILQQQNVRAWDSSRFRPVVTPQNEAVVRGNKEATPNGVDTSDYQWRKVVTPEFILRTNKTQIKLRRGELIGMRFVKPAIGGIIVSLDGMYESVTTAEYDRVAAEVPVMKQGSWPTTHVSPDMIALYRERKTRNRVRDRNDREKQERAEIAAERKQEREERLAKEQAERDRVKKDASDNTVIAKEIARAARDEDARQESVKEERRNKGGVTDEELRNAKKSDLKPMGDVLNAQDVDDDEDFGEEVQEQGQRAGVSELVALYQNIAATIASKYSIPKGGLSDKGQKLMIALRAKLAEDRPVLSKTGDASIIKAWKEILKAPETLIGEDPNAVKDEPEAKPSKVKPKAAPAEEDPDAEEEPDAEEDPDAEEEPDAEEDPDAEDFDAEGEEEDPDAEEEPEDEEEDPELTADEEDPDADVPDAEEDPDAEEEPEDEDPDAEEEPEDEEEDPDAEEDSDTEVDEFDEDSSDIAAGLTAAEDEIEDDDSLDDLEGLEDEDLEEDAETRAEKDKTAEKEAKDKSEGEPEVTPPKESEDEDFEEEDGEEDPDAVIDNAGGEDETADEEMPNAAGVKGASEEAEEGELITFHDDAKLKRRFLVVSSAESKVSDKIIEYKLWDYDNKPETYVVVRVNTARGRTLLDMADKVGQVTPKEFNTLSDKIDNYALDKSPIRS